MVDASIAILPADTLALDLLMMVVMASYIGQKISWPATNLLLNERSGGVDWSLVHQLMHLMDKVAHPRCVLISSSGSEDHISLHVTGGLVMLAMADLPAKVRDQESGVAYPADGVVERLAWREGLMPTLMRQYPQSCAKETLDEGIARPEGCPHREGWHIFGCAVGVEEVEGRCK